MFRNDPKDRSTSRRVIKTAMWVQQTIVQALEYHCYREKNGVLCFEAASETRMIRNPAVREHVRSGKSGSRHSTPDR